MTKIYRRVRERFYWPKMRDDIKGFIRKCSSCQERNLVHVKTRKPMLITDTSAEPFEKIALDTVGPLPTTPRNNKHILTIQDNLTKYCVTVPVPNIKDEFIAHALVTNFTLKYGAPRVILTDRGTSFVNSLFTEVRRLFKTKHITTSSYRPQSNGALARSHMVLADYIKHYIEEFDDWDELIPFAMFSYNTAVHEGTNFTPYELVFGKLARKPSSFPTYEKLTTYNSYLGDLISRLTEMQDIAGEQLKLSKQKSKEFYDRKVRPFTGKIGDMARV